MSVLLINGNSLSIPLADESVHCCITSPPYWGLRNYNIDGQLGLERTPEEYVANMVAVFREVWRILRPDGTLWLNLGDSYATHASASEKHAHNFRSAEVAAANGIGTLDKPTAKSIGLKEKDLCGIPWRVAFALQADGWYLRSDIIWSKPNPMPESVTDRPTKAHEYLFLLAKSQKYFYDADAVREPLLSTPEEYLRAGKSVRENHAYGEVAGRPLGKLSFATVPAGRNRRTVWEIATAPYPGSHFATFPPALVEPCVKAGTSERGVCPECGKPWERVTTQEREYTRPIDDNPKYQDDFDSYAHTKVGLVGRPIVTKRETTGWQPTCAHDAQPIPAVIFDPFAGSGTTLVVARSLGRHGVGLDLSMRYLVENARARLELDKLDAWTSGKKDGAVITDLPLFAVE